MSVRTGIPGTNQKKHLRTKFLKLCCAAWILGMAGCTGGFQADPLVEYSTELNVEGLKPQTWSRPLRAGVYLLEIRERDIDLRVGVDAGPVHSVLDDAYLRHGIHRQVVSLAEPATVTITLSSIDQREWHGAAAISILRWPESAPDAAPNHRLLGFMALGAGNVLIGKGDSVSWRASLEPMREAAAHFLAANDLQMLAEAEYQRGNIEFNLVFDFEAGRKTAEAALSHFEAAGDEAGANRAAVLLALDEFNIARGLSPDIPRSKQIEMLDRADARIAAAGRYFEAHAMKSDALTAMVRSIIRPNILGEYDKVERISTRIRDQARARGDKFFEAGATNNLAICASRKSDMQTAAALYEQGLALIDRDRNADLYATLLSNLGYALISLGEFDRALVIHTEALDVFSARGEDGQTARALTALSAIQFRTGDLERAIASVQSALPLYEHAHDQIGESSALRLAGNAAGELGQHDLALEYLRKAEQRDPSGIRLEGTRVLMAGELRALGDLRSAEKLLALAMGSDIEAIRADALAERARLRQAQHRTREALADLQEADDINKRLNLDFNRIDTSSALALALLDAGDLRNADAAATAAVDIETRIRVKSANPEIRARFLSASYAPYEARIEVDLAGGGKSDDRAIWNAFRTAETIRARSLADRLVHAKRRDNPIRDDETERLREKMTALQMNLERRLRKPEEDQAGMLETRRQIDETRARVDARSLTDAGKQGRSSLSIAESRAAVQSALPEDTAVLAYFVGDRRSHAWLLTKHDLRHAVLPGRRQLQNLVNTFVSDQRTGTRTTGDATFSPLLGNLLVGVEAKRLLILPDGPLNGLPFAALPMPRGQPKELLIDRFVLTAAPSLALALQPRMSRMPGPMRVAVISDPVYTPDDRRLTLAASDTATYRGPEGSSERLARLPYSAIEARAVVRAFAGIDVIELAGFNATARSVIALPSDELGVLHFATHAIARRDAPEQSALFLSEYAADGSQLASDRLTADDIERSGLHAEVVVLSGCATGDGRELRGEGVLGLTYGFLANGSHTVVASLWPVEDALTARFMEEFYSAYRVSGRAPDALRIAQLKTRGSGAESVWSSFVVRTNGLP
jgi:CHAT domain-containing protein